MNTTKWRFRGQHSETTGDRRLDASSGSGVEEEGEGEDFTTIDKHLGVPVEEVEWMPKPVRWPTDEPNFIPLLKKHKEGTKRCCSSITVFKLSFFCNFFSGSVSSFSLKV